MSTDCVISQQLCLLENLFFLWHKLYVCCHGMWINGQSCFAKIDSDKHVPLYTRSQFVAEVIGLHVLVDPIHFVCNDISYIAPTLHKFQYV